jgi:serine/threonine-protein kinase
VDSIWAVENRVINQLLSQRYEVVERVGESALFAVYKARDTATGRVVALKAVQPAFAAEPGFQKALETESQKTAELNHPHIARFLEWSAEEGHGYLITEFVRGINLKERIRRIAPFTLSIAVDYACAIVEALHYAHSLMQPHGDLRPHNVIVSPEGMVKVTDFGIQAAVARSTAAQAALLNRAAPYHAPELAMAQPGTVAGDLYALGAILYEMLTGAPLYTGSSLEAIANQHAFSAIPSLRAINPGVPRSIEGITLKCLQKRPEQRYQTAAELLNDLKAVRDALRFGKPLSWSPIDLDGLDAGGAALAAAAPATPPPSAAAPPAMVAPDPMEPVAESVVASEAVMPRRYRARSYDDRVPAILRFAIGAIFILILLTLVIMAGIWSSTWMVASPTQVPQLVGKSIEEVRKIAAERKFTLREHPEYSEQPRFIVYKTDPKSGHQIREKQIVNVWYSRGSRYVDVPKVVGLSREEAEQRLKEAGLTLGAVTTVYSDTVPPNQVLKQNPSYKKRVMHDTPVGISVSDGPLQETEETEGNTAPGGDVSGSGETVEPNVGSPSGSATGDRDRTFERVIAIPRDGRGRRLVRIEYIDSLGSPLPVVDEMYDEGDRIPVSFVYSGETITLRIYYDNEAKPAWQKTFNPEKTRNQRIQ